MIKLKNILREIDDTDYDLYDMMSEMFNTVLDEFLSGKYKRQPWQVVKYTKVKKVWSDFAKNGFVRDEKPLDDIANQFTYLFLKLYVNTTLLGHTSSNPDEYFEEFGMSNDQIEDFGKWTDTPNGEDRLSDYALKPLYELFIKLRKSKNAEEKLILCSKILDVTHQRSDLASWFVEGGNRSLDDLAGYEKTYITENKSIINKVMKDIDIVRGAIKDVFISRPSRSILIELWPSFENQIASNVNDVGIVRREIAKLKKEGWLKIENGKYQWKKSFGPVNEEK